MLDISMRAIVPLLISSVVSTTLVLFLKGFDPMLNVSVGGTFNLQHLHMYVVLAVLCGLVSFYFLTVNGRVQKIFGNMRKQSTRWIVGGVAIGLLIFLFPPLYGEGYESFSDLMHGQVEPLFNNSLFYQYRNIPWVVVLFLLGTLFLKVVAMAVTNAAGGVGGSFAPSLFTGAFVGGTLAYICNTFFGMEMSVVNFSLVGMAGVMTGVMKAPLTSVFLIAELSNGYGLFVPLMLVASLSFAISYYLEPDSIYTKKLRAKGELVTHNKDRAVMVFLDLDKLIETNFSPVSKEATLGDLVHVISSSKRNVFPVIKEGGEFAGIILLDDIRTDMFDLPPAAHRNHRGVTPSSLRRCVVRCAAVPGQLSAFSGPAPSPVSCCASGPGAEPAPAAPDSLLGRSSVSFSRFLFSVPVCRRRPFPYARLSQSLFLSWRESKIIQ